MTREEMLKRVNLTEQEFHHLVTAFRAFYGSLNAREKAVVNRVLPTLPQALRALGGDIDLGDLQILMASGGGGTGGTFGNDGINQITNPDPNDPNNPPNQ